MVQFMRPQATVFLSVNVFVAELSVCRGELALAFCESGPHKNYSTCEVGCAETLLLEF